MAAADLAAADALAAVLPWLRQHAAVTRALGAPDRIGPYNEPPYPRLRVTYSPGGSDRGLVWLLAPEITVEVLGDLDGRHSPEALRRILYTVLGALTELPEAPAAPGAPVVTAVESTSGGAYAPLPTGQERWVSTVRVSVHPPQPAP